MFAGINVCIFEAKLCLWGLIVAVNICNICHSVSTLQGLVNCKRHRKLQTGRELLGFIKSEIKYKLTVYKNMNIRIDVSALQQLLEELK